MRPGYFDVTDPHVLREKLRHGSLILSVVAAVAASVIGALYGGLSFSLVVTALSLAFWLSLRAAVVVAWETSYKAQSSFTIHASPRQVLMASAGVVVPLVLIHWIAMFSAFPIAGTMALPALLIWIVPTYVFVAMLLMCVVYLPLLLVVRLVVRDTPVTVSADGSWAAGEPRKLSVARRVTRLSGVTLLISLATIAIVLKYLPASPAVTLGSRVFFWISFLTFLCAILWRVIGRFRRSSASHDI